VKEPVIDDMEVRVSLRDESDVVVARRTGCELASRLGMSRVSVAALATAVTEIARNIVVHAWAGEIVFGMATHRSRRGIVVIARDDGPGITNTEEAMQDGFSTSDGLGMGLPSARRLMDEFDLSSLPGKGTMITMRKWS